MNVSESPKPRAVLHAELALWAWTLWMCAYGIYDTQRSVPQLVDTINTQIEGFTITPHQILYGASVGYVGLALLSAWIVYKIGQGRHWARSSLIWGFVLEIATLAFPPYHLTDLPDIALQAYALIMLYTAPSRAWFNARR